MDSLTRYCLLEIIGCIKDLEDQSTILSDMPERLSKIEYLIKSPSPKQESCTDG